MIDEGSEGFEDKCKDVEDSFTQEDFEQMHEHCTECLGDSHVDDGSDCAASTGLRWCNLPTLTAEEAEAHMPYNVLGGVDIHERVSGANRAEE